MSKKPRKQGLNARAAINQIKIDTLPSFVYSGTADILPYGLDNQYPTRILDAIKKSPTAKGCVRKLSDFVFGQGIAQNIVVNRLGETLNDIIQQCIFHGYTSLGGYGLHFNFNALGLISEVFFVSPEYIRIHRNLQKYEYGIWSTGNASVFANWNNVSVDKFDMHDIDFKLHTCEGGAEKYAGQLLFYVNEQELYPISPLDSASISANFEKEAQIYPLANIKNGFSGNTIIKVPTMGQAEYDEQGNLVKDADDVVSVEKNLSRLHGSERAGSSLVMSMPVNAAGEAKPYQVVEHLSPTNVDTMFVNQNAKAERDILKVFGMPMILLGVSDGGMFNEDNYNQAFNYKNADTEPHRKNIERIFSKWLPYSVFGLDRIEIRPLQMKQTSTSNAGLSTI